MKKILCPIDFSDVSLNAIEFAARLAEAHHASLILLNVFTEKDFNQLLEAEHINKEYNEKIGMAEKKLKSISDEINSSEKNAGLLSCTYKVKSGELSKTILEFITEEKIDLVVMGTVGLTQLREKYIGSQTLSIIEEAHCSVFVVPDGISFHKIKRITRKKIKLLYNK